MASSLIKKDFPEPDLPKTTSLAFSKENRSKIIREPFCRFNPYIIPLSWVKVAEVKGKVDAREVVSIFRVIKRSSVPRGIVDLNPSSICRVDNLGSIRREESVDSSLFDDCSSSARDSEYKVI